jgi:hypothetical protein
MRRNALTKSASLLIALAALALATLWLRKVEAGTEPPELSVWLRNTTNATGYNGIAADVQQVRYSDNYVYVSSTGVPSYSIGPWPGNPNTAGNQSYVFKIPRHPAQNTNTKTSTPLGSIGVWKNGVVMFNALDAMSYQNQNVWHQNAVVVEGPSFDACLGHPQQTGAYHHHQNPRCLYTSNAAQHSELLGYAFDGFPVYGPYGYANANGTGGVKRMASSYRLRSITQRRTLTDGTVLSASQYGPNISTQYPLGYYAEDYEYASGAGDLDQYNGRFAVTPEYPGGTYAYYVTVNADGSSAYPYIIGPSYYGVVAAENITQHGRVTVTESVATYNPQTAPTPTPTPVPPTVALNSNSYAINENDGSGVAAITVNRSGDAAQTFTVDYATSDQSGATPCQTNGGGIASDRCDYATAIGTLRFAGGETTKTIYIPIINDSYVEPAETFTIALRNAQGATLGTNATATVMIVDDNTQAAASNPIDDQAFFIREQYVDFLGRVAETDGFNFWMDRMTNCPQGQTCDRTDTSMRFFQSDEFQARGFYVYRLYDAVLGRLPLYTEFVPDVARLNGFQTTTEQQQNRDAYLSDFINRQEFKTLYGQYLTQTLLAATDAAGFVNALCAKAGITPASKQALMTNLQTGARDPAHTVEDFILTTEISGTGTLYYDRGFIVMQYFGYLRRDPEAAGFTFWQNQLMDSTSAHRQDYRFMVGGFLNSDEYRFRFALLPASP